MDVTSKRFTVKQTRKVWETDTSGNRIQVEELTGKKFRKAMAYITGGNTKLTYRRVKGQWGWSKTTLVEHTSQYAQFNDELNETSVVFDNPLDWVCNPIRDYRVAYYERDSHSVTHYQVISYLANKLGHEQAYKLMVEAIDSVDGDKRTLNRAYAQWQLGQMDRPSLMAMYLEHKNNHAGAYEFIKGYLKHDIIDIILDSIFGANEDIAVDDEPETMVKPVITTVFSNNNHIHTLDMPTVESGVDPCYSLNFDCVKPMGKQQATAYFSSYSPVTPCGYGDLVVIDYAEETIVEPTEDDRWGTFDKQHGLNKGKR